MTAAAPWAHVEIDPERVVAELSRRFPGVRAWWGEFTGQWWALCRDRSGRDWLIEAPNPVELGRRLEAILGRMVPRFTRAALQTGAAARPTPPLSRVSRAAVPSNPPAGEPRGGRLRAAGRRLLDALTGVVE
ncbi:hypothetical protein [Streptomyces halstedii]|uniref:hypothetical protein n=1 Tax=Streptomyces halstedii TaxID=1944 RepID=UPI00334A8323